MSEMTLNYENMVERSTTTISYSYIWRGIHEFVLVYIVMCNVWYILCQFCNPVCVFHSLLSVHSITGRIVDISRLD